jgi:predicted permease
MIRTLAALWRVDPGFNPSHAITFTLAMPATSDTTSAETRARLRNFDDKVRSITGVQAVSVTLGSRPMIHDSALPFWIEGEPKPAHDSDMHAATFFLVETGFREAMGITLQRGRFVTDQDNENTPIAIDIDDNFARTYFAGQNPIGKHINFTEFNVQAEVVGVVGHVKQYALDADPPGAIQAQFFYPFMQIPEKVMPLVAKSVAVVLRTHGDPTAVMGRVHETIREIDPRDVVYNVQTMDDVVATSYAARRLTMILLTGFAALAIALACVGLYGVVSYLVGQRTQELGIRMALGAQRRDILFLVLGEGTKMALTGALFGTLAALVLTRLMAKQLFGVSAYDPLTYVSVAFVLMLVAIAACFVPARRAVRVDPMKSLRWE